jgi:hypothetical protein
MLHTAARLATSSEAHEVSAWMFQSHHFKTVFLIRYVRACSIAIPVPYRSFVAGSHLRDSIELSTSHICWPLNVNSESALAHVIRSQHQCEAIQARHRYIELHVLGVQSAGWFDIRRSFLWKSRATSLEKCHRRLIRILSMWCREAAFFSASGAALSHEVPTVKWMSKQPALWTPDIYQHAWGAESGMQNEMGYELFIRLLLQNCVTEISLITQH